MKNRKLASLLLAGVFMSGCIRGVNPAETAGTTNDSEAQMTAETAGILETELPPETKAETQKETEEQTETAGMEVQTVSEESTEEQSHALLYQVNEQKDNYMEEDCIYVTGQAVEILTPGYDALNEAMAADANVRWMDAMSQAADWIDDVREMVEEQRMEHGSIEWESMVQRADPKVVSVAFERYFYMGGAHPWMYTEGRTWDSETGTLLQLTDVVQDVEQVYEAAVLYLQKETDVADFGETYADTLYAMFFPTEGQDSIPWTLDEEALTLYIDQGSIAPYAMGAIEVILPYAAYPEMVLAQYQ